MPRLILALLAAAVVLSACGESDEGGAAPAPPQPAAALPADFPSAKGKTLAQLTKGLSEGAVLKISNPHTQGVGRSRLSFALADRADKELDVSEVAIYFASQDGSDVHGPFVAHKESRSVDTPYRSQLTSSDLASGDTFYVASPAWRERGNHAVIAVARLDGRLVIADSPIGIPVGARGGPPGPGERAIRVHTETPADVGGDLTKITTRIPAATALLKTDFADVVGKKPVVLLFATPALCQSRTCAPVVDIAEQVRAEHGKGVAFIQQEIYVGNNIDNPARPQVQAWRLPSEPWAFVIDKKGRIRERFEGVFSVGELARAVTKVQ